MENKKKGLHPVLVVLIILVIAAGICYLMKDTWFPTIDSFSEEVQARRMAEEVEEFVFTPADGRALKESMGINTDDPEFYDMNKDKGYYYLWNDDTFRYEVVTHEYLCELFDEYKEGWSIRYDSFDELEIAAWKGTGVALDKIEQLGVKIGYGLDNIGITVFGKVGERYVDNIIFHRNYNYIF